MINPLSAAATVANVGISSAMSTLGSLGVINAPKIPLPKVPKIKFDAETIILWVPGTSNHEINPFFKKSAENLWKSTNMSAEIVLVDYLASWRLSTSIPHGKLTLEATLDHIIKHKKPNQRIVIAGESQGALIIGEVLSNPKYSNVISKAVLIGHPGVAHTHYSDRRLSEDKIIEINNSLDPATFDWKGDKEDLIEAADKVMNLDLTGLPVLLKTAIKDPMYALWLGLLQLNNVPGLGELIPDPHEYSNQMGQAVIELYVSVARKRVDHELEKSITAR